MYNCFVEVCVGKISTHTNYIFTVMRKPLRRKTITLGLIAAGFLLPVGWGAQADTMSSTNYKIQADVISVGGNESSSTNFAAQDTIGEFLSGEGLSSANFSACVGYQCYMSVPYISFSVTTGTSRPGSTAGVVSLGEITTDNIRTSNGSTVNSIFLDAETNAIGGLVVYVRSIKGALGSASTPADTVDSQSETITAGNSGYGICISDISEDAESPSVFTKASPYNGSCDYSTNHQVGELQTTAQAIAQSSSYLKEGQAEILVKAAADWVDAAHSDYQDQLIFTVSGTF